MKEGGGREGGVLLVAQDGATVTAKEGPMGRSGGDLQLREGKGVAPKLGIGVGIKLVKDLQLREGRGVAPKLGIGVRIKLAKELTESGKTGGGAARCSGAPVGGGRHEDVHKLHLAKGDSLGPVRKEGGAAVRADDGGR
jgi:hypothetical protein